MNMKQRLCTTAQWRVPLRWPKLCFERLKTVESSTSWWCQAAFIAAVFVMSFSTVWCFNRQTSDQYCILFSPRHLGLWRLFRLESAYPQNPRKRSNKLVTSLWFRTNTEEKTPKKVPSWVHHLCRRNCGMAKVYNRHLDCYGERTPLAAAAESGFEETVALLLLGASGFWAVDLHSK